MNTRLTSSPTLYTPSSQQADRSSAAAAAAGTSSVVVSTATPPQSEATVAPSDSLLTADQSAVTQHADYAFSQESVQFPENSEVSEEVSASYAGLGEILGGIAALFSGAPSASFSPVIEQANKNLAERRSPQKQQPVEVDTAASDKKMTD